MLKWGHLEKREGCQIMQIPSAAQPGQVSVKSRMYRTLYETQDFCSKQALAKKCSVSMPTMYQNLAELMEEGLVRYSGEGRSTGGRRAQGLEIVPDARFSVGISVTEKNLRLVAADLRLKELAYQTVAFDTCALLTEGMADLSGILEAFLDDFSLDRNKLLGVGIAIPGILNRDHTEIDFAPTLGLKKVSIRTLTENIPYPTYVDNDGSASGHAECFVRRGPRDMAYLSLENGVGGAVLIGGNLYSGANERSGEFGHLCVEPGGLPCACGKLGCLEPYCSPLRIEKAFGVTLDEFFRGVSEHNPEYETMLYDMLRHLAIAVNSIHMTLDCDVILGGFFTEYLQPWLPVLKSYVRAGDPFNDDTSFVQLSTLRHHITPLGAALHFLREFITQV